MKIVIDTSILIDYFRGGKQWETFIHKADKTIKLYLPTVVIFELFSGVSTKNPRKKQDVADFIKKFRVVDLDEQIAKRAGELYRDTKIRIEAADYIIAASALEIDGTVLALNTKHFKEIPNLSLYQF